MLSIVFGIMLEVVVVESSFPRPFTESYAVTVKVYAKEESRPEIKYSSADVVAISVLVPPTV